MKHNRNIFIIIGVVALTWGQLQGLTPEQSAKLAKLRQKLDLRYNQDIPEAEQAIWLDENKEIIEQMRLLDLQTATEYQKKQGQFIKKIAEDRQTQIMTKIKSVKEQIENELAKSPNNYQEVDFSEIPNAMVQINQTIADTERLLAPTPFYIRVERKIFLEQRQLELGDRLAIAILTNLIGLAGPIKRNIATINNYIDNSLALPESEDIFPAGFDRSSINRLINDEINPRLASASQKGFLVSRDIISGKVDKITWNTATIKASEIVNQVTSLLLNFSDYIKNLNILSKKGKENKENPLLEINNFFVTIQAIKTMNDVIENLYSNLPGIFRNGSPLVSKFDKQIDYCKDLLSGLKTDLYNIYQVESYYYYYITTNDVIRKKENDKIYVPK